jgi:hypothetical protein
MTVDLLKSYQLSKSFFPDSSINIPAEALCIQLSNSFWA